MADDFISRVREALIWLIRIGILAMGYLIGRLHRTRPGRHIRGLFHDNWITKRHAAHPVHPDLSTLGEA